MDKIKTPCLRHLTSADYERVYEPAEDSFLMLDALEAEMEEIKRLNPAICVEIGSGSGILSVGLASVLKETCFFMATDINPTACSASAQTASNNSVTYFNSIRSSCLSGIRNRLEGQVDVFLCNPPYVDTPEEEIAARSDGLGAAWAGGHQGMTLTNAIIDLLPSLLTPKGRAYLVLEQCNKPDLVLESLSERGLKGHQVMKRRAGRELLQVLCLTL